MTLSPRSVLNFLEDDGLPIMEDQLISFCHDTPLRRGEKRKLLWLSGLGSAENINGRETPDLILQQQEQEETMASTCRRRTTMNFRQRLVCDQTVEWLASVNGGGGGGRKLEELRLGPVFESSRTVLSAIATLPCSVTHLDLDLRNALHLLPEVMPLLFHKSHLVSLSIRLFGDSGAVELSKCLHLNPNLKRLDLRDNRIGNEGLRAIVRAIGNCHLSLECLNLSCNCILDADPIRELLDTTTSLRSLDISFNWIGNRDVDRLCVGLRNNVSLHRLNMFGCQRITQVGLLVLSKCLENHNTSLQHVYIQTLDANSSSSLRLQSEQLDHWLSLNRAGRSLLRSETAAQSPLWPVLLAKSGVEPTTLYHMLQQGGPQLFGR